MQIVFYVSVVFQTTELTRVEKTADFSKELMQ